MEQNKIHLSFLRSLYLITSLLFFFSESTFSQTSGKYLVVFKDKNNSPYSTDKPLAFLSQRSVARRERQKIAFTSKDLPVNPAYIQAVKNTGAKVIYTSRWMNAALIQCSSTVLSSVLSLSFVKGLEVNMALDNPSTRSGRLANKFETLATNSLDHGLATTQNNMIGADKMLDDGFRGEGMLIGILDAGFKNANNIPAFKPIFDENRIVGTYDFVENNQSVYEDDSHGTEVLSCIGAYSPSKMIGTAFQASFLLLRSEDASSEYLIEEANWLFAVEYADSVGVDLINSSLGYTVFDDSKMNHTYADMDGKTTIAARAAAWAASVGIICVISAGNDGNGSWRYISTPADADSILAVGAVDALNTYAIFSSIGPSSDRRVKPDVVAMGQSVAIVFPNGNVTTSQGTSFSSPILCGMVAGFWQANPTLTAIQVIERIRKSGHQYMNPDERLGYGIPDFTRAKSNEVVLAVEDENNSLFSVYPNPSSSDITVQINDSKVSNYYSSLMDITGKTLMYQEVNTATFKMSLANLAVGTYFLRIGNDAKSALVKVLKVE
jgi:hypothetical protein